MFSVDYNYFPGILIEKYLALDNGIPESSTNFALYKHFQFPIAIYKYFANDFISVVSQKLKVFFIYMSSGSLWGLGSHSHSAH